MLSLIGWLLQWRTRRLRAGLSLLCCVKIMLWLAVSKLCCLSLVNFFSDELEGCEGELCLPYCVKTMLWLAVSMLCCLSLVDFFSDELQGCEGELCLIHWFFTSPFTPHSYHLIGNRWGPCVHSLNSGPTKPGMFCKIEYMLKQSNKLWIL